MSEEDDESIGRRILLDDESRKIRRRILQRGKKIRVCDSRYLINILKCIESRGKERKLRLFFRND